MIIRNARWFDGTGAPSAVRNIAVLDGHIAAVTPHDLDETGGTEVIDAARAYAAAVAAGKEKLNDDSWATFSRYLYTSDLSDPDLVIRTSGETRVSNFLLMQAAYAEFVFTPVLWPDFTRADLAAAVAAYAQRERRFGQTSAQINPASTPR